MAHQYREVRLVDIILYFVIPLALALIDIAYLVLAIVVFNIPLWITLVSFIISFYLICHFLAIGSVLMYKVFAPQKMRDQCRFEPTCSTYMILAIKKYGLLIGVIKGLKRIHRCVPPNGGVDYP